MDTLIEDILESLAQKDVPVREVLVGSRCVAVRGRRVGLAYYFAPDSPACGPAPVTPRPLADGLTCQELAEKVRSDDLVTATEGVAAINSLVSPPGEELEEGDAYELIASRGEGKVVTVVGHFPFVERLRPLARRLNVLELRPQDGDLPATEAARVIPESDLVALTGATLGNHTMGGILDLARGKYVVVLGPSTVLSPVLFDHGVSAICGAVVTDPDEVLRTLIAGRCLRKNPGLRKVLWKAGGS